MTMPGLYQIPGLLFVYWNLWLLLIEQHQSRGEKWAAFTWPSKLLVESPYLVHDFVACALVWYYREVKNVSHMGLLR
jgi:hypothetical protein